MASSIEQNRTFTVGDCNFHIDQMDNADARRFLDILDSFDLTPHVVEPTHRGGHILDLVISKANENLVADCYVPVMCLIRSFCRAL